MKWGEKSAGDIFSQRFGFGWFLFVCFFGFGLVYFFRDQSRLLFSKHRESMCAIMRTGNIKESEDCNYLKFYCKGFLVENHYEYEVE